MFRFRICIIRISNLPICFSFVKRLCPLGSIFFILDGKSCHFIIIIIITCRKGNEPDSSKSISTLCKGCISNHKSILNRGETVSLACEASVSVPLVSFLARPKPRISFLCLSLLRNSTETLATQATVSPKENP